MIDLGAWLSEKRGIPAEAQEPDTGTSNDSPPEPES
jgi:endogenous inhibitor of DNA gyrase (YacG/DUF329 family)